MKQPLSSPSVLRNAFLNLKFPSPYLLLLLPFILFVLILNSKDFNGFLSKHLDPWSSGPSFSKNETQRTKLHFAIGETKQGCDVFSGKWVMDESTRPLYEASDCPYIHEEQNCQKYGRPDKEYQYWRWQPHNCSLPSFNAKLMLETLRGKRMMFVGDSLNRGQYVSFVCLLHSIIPEDSKSMKIFDESTTESSPEQRRGSFMVFTAKDYNATIEYYWAPFLLESNVDEPVAKHGRPERIVRNDSIMTNGQYWTGADIMVFSTYVWWLNPTFRLKILRGSFDDEVKDIVELQYDEAYRMGMKSLVGWIEKNMDPKKTRVFFTSMSPAHQESAEWGGKPGGKCYNETTPIEDPTYWGSECLKDIMQLIGEEFSKSKVPITFLNITQLSSYRKDAHSSIYKRRYHPFTPEELANPASFADCLHWCLPGVSDTWNELLFTKLFYP